MHHVVVEEWSTRHSVLHARDARAKFIVTLVFLVALGVAYKGIWMLALALLIAIFASKLPISGLLLRAAAILPFSATFALVSWFAGDPARGLLLIAKSYLSATAALLLIGTTPLPVLLRGLESLGVPRFLTLVIQFLYRYLFVLTGQARNMRIAARCRSGTEANYSGLRFQAAAGALSVLFARSYLRAEGIHRAMTARGFAGHFPLRNAGRFGPIDFAFTLIGSLVLASIWYGNVRGY